MVIAFDADDTLWHNESRFASIQDNFAQLLSAYHSREWIDEKLLETEVRNLEHFGYGVKGFTLSMIETAIELTEGRITGAEIATLISLAKDMLRAPVELLAHVQETVEELARHAELMLITKGDLFDQESKLARSGLGPHFAQIEIVSEKNTATYRRIMQKHGIAPEDFCMVGNSVKSDILPVLEAGGRAIYIPYAITWVLEQATLTPHERLTQLEHMGQLLEHLSERMGLGGRGTVGPVAVIHRQPE